MTIEGGIFGYGPEATYNGHPFTLVEAYKASSIALRSVHCEGITKIIDATQSDNLSIQNSFMHVPNSQFTLVRTVNEAGTMLQNSVSVISNTFRFMKNISVPTNLFLTCGSAACDTVDFPLGIYTGNVGFYNATNGTVTPKTLPTRFGHRVLTIDHMGETVGVGRPGDLASKFALDVRGSIKALGQVQVGTAVTQRPGALRYRVVNNTSYLEVCMQDDSDHYSWKTLISIPW